MKPSEVNPIDWIKNGVKPVFLVHGTQDAHIPPAHAERLCEAIGERGVCHFVDGASHMNAWAMLSDQVRVEIVRFLGEGVVFGKSVTTDLSDN